MLGFLDGTLEHARERYRNSTEDSWLDAHLRMLKLHHASSLQAILLLAIKKRKKKKPPQKMSQIKYQGNLAD